MRCFANRGSQMAVLQALPDGQKAGIHQMSLSRSGRGSGIWGLECHNDSEESAF